MRNRTYTAGAEPGDTVIATGWVHEARNLGDIAFLILRDTSGKIQVKFERDEMDDDPVETGLGVHRGSVISVTGEVDEEPRVPTDVEVTPESLDVITEAKAQFPFDSSGKVDAELLTRLDNRTPDFRKNEVKAAFEIRAEVQRAIRDKLHDLRATEINTPKIVATGTKGGAELFSITYFGQEAFMNQPPQLFKQLTVGSGLERVSEAGPIFRVEEHNTLRHLNEATSIGLGSAFTDHTEATDAREIVITVAYEVIEENYQDELEALGLEGELEAPSGESLRLTYEGVIECINATGELDEQLVWGDDSSTKGEKAPGEDVGEHYLTTDRPSEIKSFYIKDHDDDEAFSTDFDMMHPNMELVSDGQREHRFDRLVAGFEQQELDPDAFKHYMKMFKYDMPPHAGFGFGSERFIMTMLGLENIREAVLFPQDRQRLSP